MKLFRSSLLLMGELAAFSWFLLRNISFLAVLPLIPLGLGVYFLNRYDGDKFIWFNGIAAIISGIMICVVVTVGIFEGRGFIMLFFLMIACALSAVKIQSSEWARIAGWWMSIFLIFFLFMVIASAFGAEKRSVWLDCGSIRDIIIFYILALGEPIAMGKKYRAAPLGLGILLIPFGFLSYLALGKGAFCSSEFPYLSVLSGVSLASFHHLEGILLCLLFGAGIFRIANFLIRYSAHLKQGR
ncbi:MAG: hypothetical protein IKK30_03380 [Clostridia bacterium]|nr:hypothetical protein [Clostridia bacterium]